MYQQSSCLFIILSLFLYYNYCYSIENIPLACELKKHNDECILSTQSDSNSDIKQSCIDNELSSDNRRVIAIGDIHGSYIGLLELLYYSNITISINECIWKPQVNIDHKGTILIQVGDIVDRGPQALEALLCLQNLQKNAYLYNSKVIRLLGSMYDMLLYIYTNMYMNMYMDMII